MLLGAVDIMIENELKDGYGFRSENLYIKLSKKGSMVSISVYPFVHVRLYLCFVSYTAPEYCEHSIILSRTHFFFTVHSKTSAHLLE